MEFSAWMQEIDESEGELAYRAQRDFRIERDMIARLALASGVSKQAMEEELREQHRIFSTRLLTNERWVSIPAGSVGLETLVGLTADVVRDFLIEPSRHIAYPNVTFLDPATIELWKGWGWYEESSFAEFQQAFKREQKRFVLERVSFTREQPYVLRYTFGYAAAGPLTRRKLANATKPL